MEQFRPGYTNPKDTLKNLRIYRNILHKQIQYLPFNVKHHALTHLAYVDYVIQDYVDFFKTKQQKYYEQQLQLFLES